MDVLEFIFVLGINFSIFGFIWGIFMILFRMLQGNGPKKESIDYLLRIVKYFLLVSVTANYISKFELTNGVSQGGSFHVIVGVIVLALYLLGKLQNRTMLSQLANNPMFNRMISKIDPKVERFLLIGSLAYFVVCLTYPPLVDTAIVNWFTDSIINIYDTPFIGWVFSVIAFFFLINILIRASNVIGNLLSGRPLTAKPNGGGQFNFNGGKGNGRNPFENNPFEQKKDQFHKQETDSEGFSDYEDVTEEED